MSEEKLTEGKREIMLRVAEAKQRDLYKGRARIGRADMERLNINSGDFIELEGKSKTVVIALPAYPEDEGSGLIRIEYTIRKNAGVNLGEMVVVRPAVVNPAISIKIATQQPLDPEALQQITEYVKKKIIGRPFVENDIFQIPGMSQYFRVVSTKPKGPVVVTEETNIVMTRKVGVLSKTIHISYEDIGGLTEVVEKVREMIELPLRYPELFKRMGIEPPKGILFYGPPGTGKTLLARAIASETDAFFISVNGPEIMSKFYGESEARLREIFETAKQHAPAIIFIDELDALAPKRSEVTGEVEKRVVAQLLALMDGLEPRSNVIVIGATNMINAIDPALRRPGRFDREIEFPVPNKQGRLEILKIHTRGMPLAPDVNLERIAEIAHGFVGADLAALCREAAMRAIRRIFPQIDFKLDHIPAEILEKAVVTNQDFMDALKSITPSALREVYVEVPNVRWSDIGGLKSVKRELEESLIWPIKYPQVYEKMGIEPPRGILLVGAPGTGKTMLAKAIATESGLNFISISGPEIYSKWVGESERAIREVFRKARMGAPSIVFLDEVESIGAFRGVNTDEGVSERVLSQLLTEMDGFRNGGYVFVLAATNRPDLVDPALLRPGRFDRIILVNPPTVEERIEILQIYTRKTPLAPDVDLKEIARRTEGYTGSDLKALVREAALSALREDMNVSIVKMEHFIEAMNKIKPSINEQIVNYYVNWVNKARQLYASKPSPISFM
ncbi:MAG: CDC48 family AAA ATPase [Thermoprotei archaeon]|jgi:transitional endoplasmic reticulum ATPase